MLTKPYSRKLTQRSLKETHSTTGLLVNSKDKTQLPENRFQIVHGVKDFGMQSLTDSILFLCPNFKKTRKQILVKTIKDKLTKVKTTKAK
jgi:hypothetical protein